MKLLEKAAAVQKKYTYEAGVELAWWHDNAGHFVAGALIGALVHFALGFGYVGVGATFVALAGLWEAYEYTYNVRPWDPREDWSFDRAVEDTLLDTYVGLTGALLAVLLL